MALTMTLTHPSPQAVVRFCTGRDRPATHLRDCSATAIDGLSLFTSYSALAPSLDLRTSNCRATTTFRALCGIRAISSLCLPIQSHAGFSSIELDCYTPYTSALMTDSEYDPDGTDGRRYDAAGPAMDAGIASLRFGATHTHFPAVLGV